MESYLKLSIWICICQLILLTLFVAAASVVSHNKYKGTSAVYILHVFVGNQTQININLTRWPYLSFSFSLTLSFALSLRFTIVRLDMAWQCFNDKFQFVQN